MTRVLPLSLTALFAFGCATSTGEAPYEIGGDEAQVARTLNTALLANMAMHAEISLEDTFGTVGSAEWTPAEVAGGEYEQTFDKVMFNDSMFDWQTGDIIDAKIKIGADGSPYLYKAPMLQEGNRLMATQDMEAEFNDGGCVLRYQMQADGEQTDTTSFNMVIRMAFSSQGQDCVDSDGIDWSTPNTVVYAASFQLQE